MPGLRAPLGFGGVVVNLCAWRETDPAKLVTHAAAGIDVVGPDNTSTCAAVLAEAHLLVCAWGAHPIARSRVAGALAIVPEDVACECFGRTAVGALRHPSRLASATRREGLVPEIEGSSGGDRG